MISVSSHGEGSSAHAETDTFGSKVASVASSAVDFAVRGVVLVGGVQGTSTIGAAEASANDT